MLAFDAKTLRFLAAMRGEGKRGAQSAADDLGLCSQGAARGNFYIM